MVNVARYYHLGTVCVRGKDDDIEGNVQKGLDITTAENYGLERSVLSPSPSTTSDPVRHLRRRLAAMHC
jgi:hypothetical protein